MEIIKIFPTLILLLDFILSLSSFFSTPKQGVYVIVNNSNKVWRLIMIILICNFLQLTTLLLLFFLLINKEYRNMGNPLLIFILSNLAVSLIGIILTFLRGYSFNINNTYLTVNVLLLYNIVLFTGNLLSYKLFGNKKFQRNPAFVENINIRRTKIINLIFFSLSTIGFYLQIKEALFNTGADSLYTLFTFYYWYLDNRFFISKIVYLWYFLYPTIIISQILYHLTKRRIWNLISIICIIYSFFAAAYIYSFLSIFLFYFTNYFLFLYKRKKLNILFLLLLITIILIIIIFDYTSLNFFDKVVPYSFGNYINLGNLIADQSKNIPLFINLEKILNLIPYGDRLLEYSTESYNLDRGFYTIESTYGIRGNTYTFIGSIISSGLFFSIFLTFMIGFISQYLFINKYKNLLMFILNLSFLFAMFGSFGAYFLKYPWSFIFVIYIILFYPIIVKKVII